MGEKADPTIKTSGIDSSKFISRSQKSENNQPNLPLDKVLYLQRMVGNQVVQRLLTSGMTGITSPVQRQAKTKEEKAKAPENTTPKPSKAIGNFARTRCDVKVHPDDAHRFFPGQSFRTVGEGKPKIEVLQPEVQTDYPCLFEAGMAHEEQHVKNNMETCAAFKRSVDQKSSRFLWGLLGGEPTISFEDFTQCEREHNRGMMKDCFADEKSAYEAGIHKAKELLKEQRCEPEKDALEQNIKHWEILKDQPPNCKQK